MIITKLLVRSGLSASHAVHLNTHYTQISVCAAIKGKLKKKRVYMDGINMISVVRCIYMTCFISL